MRGRNKVLAACLAAMLVLLVLLLRARTAPSDDAVTAASVGDVPQRRAGVAPAPLAAVVTPNRSGGIAPPVFDEVTVEKEEVCAGEEDLVRVHAHTVDGNDADLHYVVAGIAGAQVPLRIYPGADGKVRPQYALAFSRDNVPARVELPPIRVKDCRAGLLLFLTARVLPNSTSERELTASIRSADGGPYLAVRYDWSFGDGTSTSTPGPIAVHDYRALPQATAYTDLLAKVTATDALGRTVEGRLALHIRNLAFELRRRGVIALFADPTPRFPRLDPDGVVRQTFRIWHAEDVPVELTGLTVARMLQPDAAGAPPPPRRAEAADPTVLHHTRIAPREAIEERLEFDFGSEPQVYAAIYELQGTTPDGAPARGELTLMRPPPKPTRENSLPVQDRATEIKIRRAMELLQTDTVSQEDLLRLEREGKL